MPMSRHPRKSQFQRPFCVSWEKPSRLLDVFDQGKRKVITRVKRVGRLDEPPFPDMSKVEMFVSTASKLPRKVDLIPVRPSKKRKGMLEGRTHSLCSLWGWTGRAKP